MSKTNRTITGESLIQAICGKLRDEGRHCTDSNIVLKLRNMKIGIEGDPKVQVRGLYDTVNPLNKT